MLTAAVIGNLGSDAELKFSANGSALLRMNVAANFRAKEEGEWAEKTEWVRVTVFGARAESLSRFLVKGTKVFVSGRLEARPWTTKDGDIRAGLELTADTVEFFSPRQEAEYSHPTNTVNRQPVAAGASDDSDAPF